MMKPMLHDYDDRRALVALIACAVLFAGVLGLVLDRVLEMAA